jgi:hypothetical protein
MHTRVLVPGVGLVKVVLLTAAGHEAVAAFHTAFNIVMKL